MGRSTNFGGIQPQIELVVLPVVGETLIYPNLFPHLKEDDNPCLVGLLRGIHRFSETSAGHIL